MPKHATSVSVSTPAPKKRKLSDDFAAAQRHLSRRLACAAKSSSDADAGAVPVHTQRRRVRVSAAKNAKMTRSQALAELATQLRAALEARAAQLKPQPLARVRRRLDALVRRAARLHSAARRGELLARGLATLATRALALPSAADSKADSKVGDDDDNAVARLAPAPHQWVPPVLWRVFESVERAQRRHASEESEDETNEDGPPPSDALCSRLRALVARMRELNPYSHLLVLFRPPPPSERAGHAWQVRQCDAVLRVADSLRPLLLQLHHLAFWLESPRQPHESLAACEREFDRLVRAVRGFGTHFHYVLLYLYSVAMGRADPGATASSVLRQAATHALRLDVRGAYGLRTSLLALADPLVHQSYAFFPEVLVFLDAWRHDASLRAYGFGSSAEAAELVVDFARVERKDQRALAGVADCLKDIFHAWRRSRLGTDAFESMQIHELGALETLVKGRLRAVVDLLYAQNLAAWIRRRQTNRKRRILHEVEIVTPPADEPATEDGEPLADESATEQLAQENCEPPTNESVKENCELSADEPAKENCEPPSEPANDDFKPQFEPPKPERRLSSVCVDVTKLRADSRGSDKPTEPPLPSPVLIQAEQQESAAVEAVDRRRSPEPKPDCSLLRRRHHPKNSGRFRAPGVLNMKEQQQRAAKQSDSSVQPTPSRVTQVEPKPTESASRHHHEPFEPSLPTTGEPAWGARAASAEHEPSAVRSPRSRDPVQLEDIYVWTDAEIDANEEETEHIYELQQELQALRDKLALEPVLQEINAGWQARGLPRRPKRGLALLESWRCVQPAARAAVCDAETVALHGAAEALIRQPGLRVEKREPPADEPHAALAELRATVGSTRRLVDALRTSYSGERSEAWRTHLAFFAQTSTQLLEVVAESVALPMGSSTESDDDSSDSDSDNDTCSGGDEPAVPRSPDAFNECAGETPEEGGAAARERLSARGLSEPARVGSVA